MLIKISYQIHAIQWAIKANVAINNSSTAAPYSLYLSIFLATLTSRKRRAAFNKPVRVVVCKQKTMDLSTFHILQGGGPENRQKKENRGVRTCSGTL